MKVTIRSYRPEDHIDVRQICYESSFQGKPELFGLDRDFVADVLTGYYLEQEPDLCFVALDEAGHIAGYIFGARDERAMRSVWRRKTLPFLIRRWFQSGTFYKFSFWRLSLSLVWSLLRGECRAPGCSKDFPAVLHINIRRSSRSLGLGHLLMESFLRHLQEIGVSGVHLSTNSDEAKSFFERSGFRVLYSSRRTYYQYKLGQDIPRYLMTKRIS